MYHFGFYKIFSDWNQTKDMQMWMAMFSFVCFNIIFDFEGQ